MYPLTSLYNLPCLSSSVHRKCSWINRTLQSYPAICTNIRMRSIAFIVYSTSASALWPICELERTRCDWRAGRAARRKQCPQTSWCCGLMSVCIYTILAPSVSLVFLTLPCWESGHGWLRAISARLFSPLLFWLIYHTLVIPLPLGLSMGTRNKAPLKRALQRWYGNGESCVYYTACPVYTL